MTAPATETMFDPPAEEQESVAKGKRYLKNISEALSAVAQIERILNDLTPGDRRKVLRWFEEDKP